ncbi:MAG: DUF2384 domain-containing protein [Gemmataceae bacterium]|nr:DUF2384 domain-containing protein [Gemmataceae bacterium]
MRRMTMNVKKINRRKTQPAADTFSVPKSSASVSLRDLRMRFELPRKDFSRLLGFSERAVAAWEANEPISRPAIQRLQELRRLHEALARVMKATFVGVWLQTPNAAFQGLKPLEVIERGEVDRIWRMIYEVESGTPF